jgi:hypothetical protein
MSQYLSTVTVAFSLELFKLLKLDTFEKKNLSNNLPFKFQHVAFTFVINEHRAQRHQREGCGGRNQATAKY